MGKYNNTDWYQQEVEKYQKLYGEVPPPWILEPDSHPYSARWRMGGGETYMMTWHEWFPEMFKTEVERIDYFKKYPPPPRWFGWTANAIWDISSWTHSDFSYTPYFEKLANAGFAHVSDYQKDLDDDRWSD